MIREEAIEILTSLQDGGRRTYEAIRMAIEALQADTIIINNKKSQQPKIGDDVFVRGRIDEIRRDTVIIRNDGGYFGTDYSEVVKFFVEDDVVYGVQLFRQDGERGEE